MSLEATGQEGQAVLVQYGCGCGAAAVALGVVVLAVVDADHWLVAAIE